VPQQRATQNYYHQERKAPNRKKRSALTEKQVTSIRRALQKKKPGTIEELAKKFHVSKWTIYKIAEGKSWGSTK
jgi:response regulator of citrate/malate metabolism